MQDGFRVGGRKDLAQEVTSTATKRALSLFLSLVLSHVFRLFLGLGGKDHPNRRDHLSMSLTLGGRDDLAQEGFVAVVEGECSLEIEGA